MRERKSEIRKTIIILLLLLVIAVGTLTACDCSKEKRKDVDIIVKHPVTGEIVEDYGWMEFAYDENYIMPDISLKLREKNKYLGDKDFKNNSLTSHMQLFINIDGTYMEQRSWENDWPKEAGFYEILIRFNGDGRVGANSINDVKYFLTDLHVTLKITE